jgi:ribonuclease HI
MAFDVTRGKPAVVPEGRIIVHTDGGCRWTQKLGARAYVAQLPDGSRRQRSRAVADTTISRMEMTAVLMALKRFSGCEMLILSDSKLVVQGINEWMHWWRKAGWRTAERKPVANRDLWEELLQNFDRQLVRLMHVKGHSGIKGNERVDRICNEAMDDYEAMVLML